MGKAIKITSLIVLLFMAGLFIAYTQLSTILSSSLSKKAKVDVVIKKILFDTDDIQINFINVANPKGSTLPTALNVKQTTIEAPITTYLKDNITIDKITLDDVYLSLEFYKPNSTNGNWTYIISNLSEGSSEKGSSKEVLIKKLLLNNVNIDIYTQGSGNPVKQLKTIKKLEFTNVTSSGGIPSEQIMNVVMQQVLREIFSLENLQNMLKDALTPQNVPGKAFNTFKGLFSERENYPINVGE